MGKKECSVKGGVKTGTWTAEEDGKLVNFILSSGGHSSWQRVPKLAGLSRCGKSCRYRWNNYLRPDINHGPLSDIERQRIIDLHALHGNSWSKIASMMPGRTGNEIKNQWKTHIKKDLRAIRVDLLIHQKLHENKYRAEQTPSPFCESSENDAHSSSALSPTYNGDCESNDRGQLLEQNNAFTIDDSDLCVLMTKVELEIFLDDTYCTFLQAREEYNNYFGLSSCSVSSGETL